MRLLWCIMLQLQLHYIHMRAKTPAWQDDILTVSNKQAPLESLHSYQQALLR